MCTVLYLKKSGRSEHFMGYFWRNWRKFDVDGWEIDVSFWKLIYALPGESLMMCVSFITIWWVVLSLRRTDRHTHRETPIRKWPYRLLWWSRCTRIYESSADINQLTFLSRFIQNGWEQRWEGCFIMVMPSQSKWIDWEKSNVILIKNWLKPNPLFSCVISCRACVR